MNDILKVRNISKKHSSTIKNFQVHETLALNNVSFDIKENNISAIVGESGSGKTTLAKILIGAETYDTGNIKILGESIKNISVKKKTQMIRMIGESSKAQLNPNLKIKNILRQTLEFSGYKIETSLNNIIIENMLKVNLLPEQAEFYPYMLSKAEKQKVNIIKAIIIKPKILIVDIELNSLDIMFKMQILKLLIELKESLSMSLIFIADDLDVIMNLCDQVIIMRDGCILQKGRKEEIEQNPINKYTESLIKKYNIKIKK